MVLKYIYIKLNTILKTHLLIVSMVMKYTTAVSVHHKVALQYYDN